MASLKVSAMCICLRPRQMWPWRETFTGDRLQRPQNSRAGARMLSCPEPHEAQHLLGTEEHRGLGDWKCAQRAACHIWRKPRSQEGVKAMSCCRSREHRGQRGKRKKKRFKYWLDSKRKNPGVSQMPLFSRGMSVHRGSRSPCGNTVPPNNSISN